jgi:hypothetical protein
LHKLFLGLVQNVLHWLLTDLKARNVNHQYDNSFIQYHDIRASSASLNHSIGWIVAPGRAKRSGGWSEHLQWIAHKVFLALRMIGKLRRKQPPMKW